MLGVIFLNVENLVRPPISNRGVERTTKPYRTLCCDWVSCTFPLETRLDDVLNDLKLHLSLFYMQDYSFYRYYQPFCKKTDFYCISKTHFWIYVKILDTKRLSFFLKLRNSW